MSPSIPQPLPLIAQFESSVTPKNQSASPQTSPWTLSRCSSGKSIVDYGSKTVITDPQTQQMITLDHMKKLATITPLPSMPGVPAGMIPNMPQAPSLRAPSPPPTPLDVKDLGTKLIAGHEAQGKLYTFKAPQLPQMPGTAPPATSQSPASTAPSMPQLPLMPQLPSMPKLPSTPTLPGSTPSQPGSASSPPPMQPAAALHTMEVWTSSKLHLPMFTKTGLGTAQQTTACKQVTVGEPPGCAAQIPPDYKVVTAALKPPPFAGIIK